MLQVGCQSYFNTLTFHGNNNHDIGACFSVMNIIPMGAVSNNAIALQVAVNDDAKESNLITKKECIMAQSGMKALNKNKYYIPMDY